MKYIIAVLTLVSLGSIIIGYLTDTQHSQQLIGFGVVGLFIIVFPLFSYYRWKGKNLKDYLLTKENLDKMRERENRK
jgi:MFS-type transporter involved in bile tolerance (Atg22 family)